MQLIDYTGCSPEENLAYDEALLNLCESGIGGETLRFWESPSHFVVLGYSNKADAEIHAGACRTLDIPVLRRTSGGGTVLQGPGCINYSLILKIASCHDFSNLQRTNDYVLNRHREALQPLIPDQFLQVQGVSDLTSGSLKFSGNAQRRKKEFILFHGTFLTGFDLSLIEKTLKMPPKKPDYRGERPHLSFVANLSLSSKDIKNTLTKAWQAEDRPSDDLMRHLNSETEKLITEKYQKDEWNLKF